MTRPAGLAGQTALVTGASRGIGAATATKLAEYGAVVVLAARDADALAAVRDRIIDLGGTARVVVTDVSDPDSVQRLVSATVDRGGRLDIAVNAAAAHSRRPTRLADTDVHDFDTTLEVSLRGAYLCLRAQIAAMRTCGGGAIVNVASTAGIHPVAGLAAYAAAKHGLIGLTKVAALDHAVDRIRVNAVAPGSVHTEQLERAGPDARAAVAARIPAGRLGSPDEIAATIAWLCSDAAAYITGAVLTVDGGLLAGTVPYTGRAAHPEPGPTQPSGTPPAYDGQLGTRAEPRSTATIDEP